MTESGKNHKTKHLDPELPTVGKKMLQMTSSLIFKFQILF